MSVSTMQRIKSGFAGRAIARSGVAIAASLMVGLTAMAELRLPAIFTDHGVLQRHEAIPVWGWAEPGEMVTVSLNGASASAMATDSGRFLVHLPEQSAGGPYEMTINGSQSDAITRSDILIGDVWVCSGQSNMQWSIRNSNNPDEEIANASHPNLRIISIPLKVSTEPQADADARWAVSSPESIPNFSAVGYFFGRRLQSELNVPIGLINTSYGGSAAEAWLRIGTLKAETSLEPLLSRWDTNIANWDAAEANQRYERQLAQWEERAAAAREAGNNVPNRPRRPQPPTASNHMPAGLYNAMVHPLLPYAAKGVIWYQGESNAGRARQYRTIMPLLIEEWRDLFRDDSLPFYQVQLANFQARADQPGDSAWAELREAQLYATQTLPNSDMAVIIDIGDAGDIHPRNKQDVGYRLAQLALAHDYGHPIVPSGPIYSGMSKSGNAITLEFDRVGAGLVAMDPRDDGLPPVSMAERLVGFSIAGEDREFVWAEARIEGDRVVVSSPSVSNPVAVRYGWANNPQVNLYNKDGLPATPFRTDRFPGVTDNNN